MIALRAPTQVWSGRSGDLGASAIDGVYHGDVRHVRAVALTVDAARPEWISVAPRGASAVVFGGLLRALDDPTPDPKVRLRRERMVGDGVVEETLTVISHLDEQVEVGLRVRIEPDFAPLQQIKAGIAGPEVWTAVTEAPGSVTVRAAERSFVIEAPDAGVEVDQDGITLRWRVTALPRAAVAASWTLRLDDPVWSCAGRPDRCRGRCRTSAATRACSAGWMPRSAIWTRSGSRCPTCPARSSTPPGRRGS